MSSLVEEITKLHQLHKDGILTAEEFSRAKDQLLSLSKLPTSTNQSATNIVEVPTVVSADEEFFDLSHVGAHASAYGLLKTILSNIIRDPTESRVRTLKMANSRLASGLFSNTGALPFLQRKCGFEFEGEQHQQQRSSSAASSIQHCDDSRIGISAQATVSDVAEENSRHAVLVLPVSRIGGIQNALSYIEACEARDMKATHDAGDLGLRKRSLLLDLRKEQCVASVKAGELRAFLKTTFITSEAQFGEEGLLRSIESATLVKAVLKNALTTFANDRQQGGGGGASSHPPTRNYRRVPLSNAKSVDLLLRRHGALELLIELGGWVLRGRSNSNALVPIWSRSEGGTDSSSLNISLLPEELVLPVEVTEATVIATYEFVEMELLPTLNSEEARQRKEATENARQAALSEIMADREKRRREAERAKRLELLRLRAESGEGSGKRVTIEQAMKHLLGGGDDQLLTIGEKEKDSQNGHTN